MKYTDEEIKTLNEEGAIILKFFGYTLERCNNGFAWDSHNKVPESKILKVHGLLSSHTWINFRPKEDWNLIMAMFHKCEDVASTHPLKWMDAYNEEFHSITLFLNRNWVYEACLNFINYYNGHKND